MRGWPQAALGYGAALGTGVLPARLLIDPPAPLHPAPRPPLGVGQQAPSGDIQVMAVRLDRDHVGPDHRLQQSLDGLFIHPDGCRYLLQGHPGRAATWPWAYILSGPRRRCGGAAELVAELDESGLAAALPDIRGQG